MLISFVIPAFNEELYLPACLHSIRAELERLGADAQVIVVNNASTDRTREVALRFPGVLVVDEPRKGLTHARQAGFQASTGKLIANVDADSRLPVGWLTEVLDTFHARPQLAALSGPFIYYDLAGRQARLVHLFYCWAWLSYSLNRHILRVGSMVQGGNFVVARDALERIGGFNLDITFYGEDTDIARRLHEVGEVLFTFHLKMFSSARRLKHEGLFTMAFRYSANYLWTMFFKRPYTAEHVDIREHNGTLEEVATRV